MAEDQVDRWSYYDEYLGKNAIKRARQQYPELDEIIIKKIRSGELSERQTLEINSQKFVLPAGKFSAPSLKGQRISKRHSKAQ